MTLHDQLVVTIVDKLLIGAVIAAVGYYLKRSLDDRSAALTTSQNLMLQIRRGQQEMTLELQKERAALEKELRDHQTQTQLQITQQIAAARLPAYQRFWEIQTETADTLQAEFTPEMREDLERRLRDAFFQNGNALFLTPTGLKCYRTAMKTLKAANPSSQQIRQAFSRFRRQLKIDVGVYSEFDAATPTDPDPTSGEDP